MPFYFIELEWYAKQLDYIVKFRRGKKNIDFTCM